MYGWGRILLTESHLRPGTNAPCDVSLGRTVEGSQAVACGVVKRIKSLAGGLIRIWHQPVSGFSMQRLREHLQQLARGLQFWMDYRVDICHVAGNGYGEVSLSI